MIPKSVAQVYSIDCVVALTYFCSHASILVLQVNISKIRDLIYCDLRIFRTHRRLAWQPRTNAHLLTLSLVAEEVRQMSTLS